MPSPLSATMTDDPPRYAAPALDKGLDILECLADAPAPEGLTLKQIAEKLGRSPNELFRMIVRLHERGYLHRTPADAYVLTAKLFELAHRHPPTRRLLDAALPLMRQLAQDQQQSCHLAQIQHNQLLVLAHVDSPNPRSLSVRTGATFAPADTASGRLLIALADPQTLPEGLEPLDPQQCAKLRQQRRVHHRSRSLHGVVDLAYPVFDTRGHAIAALTIPHLARRDRPSPIKPVAEALRLAADELTQALGGQSAY